MAERVYISASAKAANTDISLWPITAGFASRGEKFQQILSCKFQDVSAPGGASIAIEAKGDGDAVAGGIRLQANGKEVRCAFIVADGDQLVLDGVVPGEVQGFGDGT